MIPTINQITDYRFYLTPQGWIFAGVIFGILALIGLIAWIADNLFAPIDVTPYGIVGFFGKRGSGKSLGMTTYARRWRHFNPHKPVFTNMEKFILPGEVGTAEPDGKGGHKAPCRCIHKHLEQDDPTDLDTHNQCTYILNKCRAVHVECNFAQISACRDGTACIDEAGVFISNLNFADRKNRQFAKWLVATRHFKVKVMLTAHTPGSINNRLRDVTDQFVEMVAFTTLRVFRGYVYDSGKAYGIPDKKSHTIWIPMLPTTIRSYNTDSLRIKADREESNIIGEDFDLPWESDLELKAEDRPISSVRERLTTTNGVPTNGTLTQYASSTERGVAVGVSTGSHSAIMAPVDMDMLDATILSSLIAATAETWNGRRPKLKSKPSTRSNSNRR